MVGDGVGGGGGGVVKNDSDTHKTVLVIGEKDERAESIVSQKEGNGLMIIYLNTVSVSLFFFSLFFSNFTRAKLCTD